MELLGKSVLLLIGGLIVWGLWRALQPGRLFIVRISGGEARAISGKVTAAFLARLNELASEHGINAGEVRGASTGTRIRLEFSRQFPASARQQMRNWWTVSGWGAPRGWG